MQYTVVFVASNRISDWFRVGASARICTSDSLNHAGSGLNRGRQRVNPVDENTFTFSSPACLPVYLRKCFFGCPTACSDFPDRQASDSDMELWQKLSVVILVLYSVKCEVHNGTSKEAEFLSAATKTFQSPKKENGTESSRSESRQTGVNSSLSQMTTAISNFDLGLGMYKMCPFPFNYLHQCETSSECPGSDCCGMYAFPGPTRWRRSCCVPSSVTTIARVARLCIKSDKRPSVTDDLGIVNEVIPHTTVDGGVLVPVVVDEDVAVPEDQVLLEEKSEPEAPMYLMGGIKKGFQSHTSVLHEGIKHIHKFHDSLQPKLHDLIKAHLKGGAADDVCPIVRVYHKHCGRPCTTHKHCKDPHYACCKVICDDPWDSHSLKKGLYCHRMIEGKLPFQHEPEPWLTDDDHHWGGSHGDAHGHLLEMLFKPKKKPPHHDSLGDKKVYLVGK